jgi:hypothetical protein
MRRVEDNFDATPQLTPRPDASNLGQVIYKHRNDSTTEFGQLSSVMRELFHEIDEIRTSPIGQNQLQLQIYDRYAQIPVPLNSAGTGVAQLMFFCALVLMSPPGRVFLIDEPHVYLHPRAEKRLAAFIRAHPEHAYVIATHSPIMVSAIEPDTVWLVTRDSAGTSLKQVFAGGTSRREVLAELGIDAGDIALYERVLFVEGNDTNIYPTLLEKLGWDVVKQDCALIGLPGGDLRLGLQRTIDRLGDVMNIRYLMYLDGDKKPVGVADSDHVKYLPVPEVEDLFLRDPGAILHGLKTVREAESPGALEPWESEWTAKRIGLFISKYRGANPDRKGSAILASLTQAMGPFEYRKKVHGPEIAKAISPPALTDLRPQFEGFLGP